MLRFPELEDVYNNKNTVVLYPSETSVSLDDFSLLIDSKKKEINNDEIENLEKNNQEMFHVIVIDGTWPQASGIYFTNLELQKLKQVILLN